MQKYWLTFEFFDTEEQAETACDTIFDGYTAYLKRSKKRPHWSPWDSLDGREHKYLVWYYR